MVKFLDLHKVNSRFREEFQEVFNKSLDDSHFILGENVAEFENEFADYCDVKHCVGTGNGLDALTLILRGYIHLGKLNKGDKVIVPANTFIATILSIMHADLVPVLVEPNPLTYNLSSEVVKLHLDDNVKAIIMVHLYGQLADFDGLSKLCEKHDLLLIEDAAQAHGAQCSELKDLRAGGLGHTAAFSFYPSKNLGALGDGGAVTTNDSKLFKAVKLLSNYGSKEKYKNKVIGFNSRLDDLQAAFLRIKLRELDIDNERRRSVAKAYLSRIRNPKLSLPTFDGSKNHVFYAFVIEVEDREHFIQFLDKNGIGWLVHYPIPPHKQDALKIFSHLHLPLTERIHKRIISLPISPVMTDSDIDTVISVLNTY